MSQRYACRYHNSLLARVNTPSVVGPRRSIADLQKKTASAPNNHADAAIRVLTERKNPEGKATPAKYVFDSAAILR